MAHDLVIRNGLVVDGTGAPGQIADVAVDGDRVTAVGTVEDRGARELDAEGKVVTPGFVDIHTHLDAQIAWDPLGSSSCWHGVTSVVMGNCGVTFAPCAPDEREYLAELMESVEDIPRDSILDGLSWDWTTYGEYLGALDRLPKGLNVGGMIGHCAVRHHVMGERCVTAEPPTGDEVATDAEIGAMCDLVDEAMAAGALGFATSRTLLHRVPDGRPVPGTWADERELFAIGDVLGRHGRGVFEVAPRFERRGPDDENLVAEIHWMAEIRRRTGGPVTFGIGQTDLVPGMYRKIFECVEAEAAAGGAIRPQTTPRGIALLFGLQMRTFFDRAPGWDALAGKGAEARLAALDDDTRRAELIDSARSTPGMDWRGVYVLATEPASYRFGPEDSLAAHAQRRGVDAVQAFVDISRETRGAAVFSFPFLNQQHDAIEWMLSKDYCVLGLADSGAHVGLIMDAGQPTWFLSHWVRDTQTVALEDAVRRLTSDTADLFGIAGRGRLVAGAFADVNVIDLDALGLALPTAQRDFPLGASRYVQRATGYDATIVNGAVFMEHGEHTGELAGVTLRS
jgi:N-acyl-D-aspartate/D-glutamate deacylase